MSGPVQIVTPEFVHGFIGSCPIPGDIPNINTPEFRSIKARDETQKRLFLKTKKYNQSSNAQKMMKGEHNCGHFTYISIPFSSYPPVKGAYIQLGEAINLDLDSRPSNLIFTFTTSDGEKISKRYDFPGFRYSEPRYCWYFLPVDLSDVMLCEITGKGRKKEHFSIISLMFIREETREETIAREAREITLARCWSQAPVVKSEFIKEGDWETWKESIPIPRDDPKVINPSFSMVKCKDDSHYMESRLYDKSLDAQLMLKGEDCVIFSHLSIPFPQSNPMKGAYICVNLHCGSPSLLFTFTDCSGKKTSKRYEFIRPKYTFEWHFISIDLPNVVLCEIEGKEMRIEDKYHRSFAIYSLVFIRDDDIPTSLPHLLPGTSSSSKKLSVDGEEEDKGM
ncbi:hypothetical protein ADUPG1_010938 [Aduncisulcus paluster]|uniref:Uncharacterized protein n=1 Tax=Aduncisulcus paluster TaxID=2918883 RepID=A0ABQ5JUH3_9EUKA|nr:hypothetical protein ADUPG1_010938 [Aduncisulcus paluster]